MTNHPNRATSAVKIIDVTDNGARRCLPATEEKVRSFRRLQDLAASGRLVMDSEDGIFGSARTARQAAKLAEVSVDRVSKGLYRTYAPNGLGEVVDLPAWIIG
ncbi:MAG: hypothetical protein M0Z28_21045 [Rhodospirillales bacterium]|nr:hypothetical protein [Rhodospirillales bacterium]